MVYNGEGGDVDLSAAREWYERAAQQDYATAQFHVAQMYYNGEGGDKDYGAARKSYESAAVQTYPPAQFNLALMYYNGEVGPPTTTRHGSGTKGRPNRAMLLRSSAWP